MLMSVFRLVGLVYLVLFGRVVAAGVNKADKVK